MHMENIQKTDQQFMTCQTEHQDLVMLTQELIPGTLYRVKGKGTTWKYALITKQADDKKSVTVLSPKRSIVNMTIKDAQWLIKEMDITFEIVQCL